MFSRRAKSISDAFSKFRKCWVPRSASMAPNERPKRSCLCRLIFFWNGGIGTYVKSSNETHTRRR
ncbi:NAD-glutamate dehydrogenase [Vibrio lentus]|nr:NAD-glutamate dehydrogenase [Vibrio lentus]